MGLLSRIFGRRKEKHQKNKPVFKGSLSDMERAYQVAEEGNWEEAFDIVSRVLSIPDDDQKAIDFLKEAMKDSSKSGIDSRIMGSDESGKTKVKVKMTLRGGMLPDLMAFHGQCLFKVIEGKARSLVSNVPKSGMKVDLGGNPEMKRLQQEAKRYVMLTMEIFWDHSDNLAVAGVLCNGLGNFKGAKHLLQRALQLDPHHQVALNAMNRANQWSEQFK